MLGGVTEAKQSKWKQLKTPSLFTLEGRLKLTGLWLIGFSAQSQTTESRHIVMAHKSLISDSIDELVCKSLRRCHKGGPEVGEAFHLSPFSRT